MSLALQRSKSHDRLHRLPSSDSFQTTSFPTPQRARPEQPQWPFIEIREMETVLSLINTLYRKAEKRRQGEQAFYLFHFVDRVGPIAVSGGSHSHVAPTGTRMWCDVLPQIGSRKSKIPRVARVLTTRAVISSCSLNRSALSQTCAKQFLRSYQHCILFK